MDVIATVEELGFNEILEKLEYIENKNMQNDDTINIWLEKITNSDYKLVDSLINLFNKNITDLKLTGNILKVFRNQMLGNKEMIKSICDYIIKTKPVEKMSNDAFIMLGEIYVSQQLDEFVSKELISSLFDAFSIIEDEDVFNSIVLVLIGINYKYTDEDENLFCAVYQENENSRYIVESLLRILNSTEDKQTMYRILKCFYDVMNQTFECILYSSDLEAFINLSIKRLESTYTEELRKSIFQVLLQLTIFDDYFKTSYKIEELTEILESYEKCSTVNEENRTLATKILENIKLHEY